MHHYQKGGRLLLGLLLIYLGTVGFHLGHVENAWPAAATDHEQGEFWPFSIFPMFSRGGRPWVRAHLRDASAIPEPARWQVHTLESLEGRPFTLGPRGIDQNDLSNFIARPEAWDAQRIAGLRKLLAPDRALLLYRVDGAILTDSISVVFTPLLLIDADTAYLNPNRHALHPIERQP